MFHLVLLLSFAVSLAGGQSLAGTQPSSVPLTLPAVLEVARRSAPSVRAAAMHRSAERALVNSEATPDAPTFELERQLASVGTNPLNGPEKYWSVTQRMPFPTTLLFRGRVAAREADAASAQLRGAEVEALARAREAYADLYEAERSLAFLDEIVELLRRFSGAAESKYAAGKAPQADALKASLELTRMLNEKTLAEAAVEGARGGLNAAMGQDEDVLLPTLAPPRSPAPTAGLSELRAVALAENPRLAAASLGSDKARAELRMKRSEWLPELSVRYRRRTANGTASHDAALGFSVPLWFWKQAGAASHASYEARYASALRDGERLKVLADLRAAHALVRTEARLREVHHTTVVPQAEAALRVAEAAYRSDRVGFLDLLDAGRSLVAARLEAVRHEADFERALAALTRAVGRETLP